MPISTLRAFDAAEEAEELRAREAERREELERGYRSLEVHCEFLENQVSELRELNERQERHDMIFTAIVVGICLLLLLFASGCKAAEAEESGAASVPPVVVDASDELAQQHRSHEVEVVEAGKLDANGAKIDDADAKQRLLQRIADYAQAKREAAQPAEEPAQEEWVEEYYEPVYVEYSGYSGGVHRHHDARPAQRPR